MLILLSKALHSRIHHLPFPLSTPHHQDKRFSTQVLGRCSGRTVVCRVPKALLAAGKLKITRLQPPTDSTGISGD